MISSYNLKVYKYYGLNGTKRKALLYLENQTNFEKKEIINLIV